MRILNFGSLNYDCVYSVDHIVLPGETIASAKMETFCGGKGLNQSVALARAGAEAFHAGLVGEDGDELTEMLKSSGIDCRFVQSVSGKSGHAIIQLDTQGQNSIVLFGGSNRKITPSFSDEVFSAFGQGDLLLLQNEINDIDLLIEKAFQKGMKIALNPSPYDGGVKKCDLSKISFLFVNEIEGYEISGEKEPDGILSFFAERCPDTAVILTLGQDGVQYGCRAERCRQSIYPVKAVDTTAAGDTFTGYFLTAVAGGKPAAEALDIASRAAAITVSRPGAAPSIPTMREVRSWVF